VKPPLPTLSGRQWRSVVLLGAIGAWAAVAWHQAHKPLPPGTHVASALCTVPASDIALIPDITAADAWGRPAVSQGIFDTVLQVIRDARRFVVLDYAGFGTGAATADAPPSRHIAGELTDALLARQREQPGLILLFITDPANESYGAAPSPDLQLLRAAGIQVVTTDLNRLRDSNLVYSSLWRLTLRWWDGPSGPLGVATRRLNFKADDRKLVLADDGHDGLVAVIGSANPQDSQSGWSNVAVRISGGTLRSLLESELDIARFSGWRGRDAFAPVLTDRPGMPAPKCTAAADPPALSASGLSAPRTAAIAAGDPPPAASARVQVLTEGALREALLARLDLAGSSDAVDAALFHLADRGVIESLLEAARRGASVRLILDPNESASRGGIEGLPNQPVASELVSRSGGAIHVRWYRTHGERFHGALVLISGAHEVWLSAGSAQLTRRSLEDYNLEANVVVEAPRGSPLAQQALEYFATLWGNRASLGIEYTADFAAFANPAQSDYWLYRLLEGAGFSSF
jgi:phosphatidylserine/phosphatidylglycerophosphate/cardiolipin synthase-like enzyme